MKQINVPKALKGLYFKVPGHRYKQLWHTESQMTYEMQILQTCGDDLGSTSMEALPKGKECSIWPVPNPVLHPNKATVSLSAQTYPDPTLYVTV